ncbi:MAG: hypothetical protein GXP55_09750 [Deltaproteobacteria bacterium]|nr:hypothetical protein [Deltaproteobacteria bacterium]
MRNVATALRLARWLLPTPLAKAKPGVERSVLSSPDGVVAWLYRPRGRAPEGSVLLLPGLHPDGPADPRLDRFCAVLADAGALVFAAFSPSYSSLVVAPQIVDEARSAFEHLLALPGRPAGKKLGVVSISFGSLPALALAASPDHGPRISRLVTFGGYADFDATLRFALAGDGDRAHDPLNRPAVYLNLLDVLDEPARDRAALEAAYRAFVRRTWGKPEMKVEGRYLDVARELAASVHADDLRLFELGTGLREGGAEFAFELLSKPEADFSYMDPTAHLDALVAPATFVHGRDDDVIPFEAAAQLERAAHAGADVRALTTGLYDHTGSAGLGALTGLGRELASARAIFADLADCIHGGPS